jgi:hypothetical protein
VIGLTWCLFSMPDVKKLSRPSLGSIVRLSLSDASTKTNSPP